MPQSYQEWKSRGYREAELPSSARTIPLSTWRKTYKKKPRGGLDPFKQDPEYQALEQQYESLTKTLEQKDAERSAVRGSDPLEYKKRSYEREAIAKQRTLIDSLMDARVESRRVEYSLAAGLIDPDEDKQARDYARWMKDRESVLKEYISDYQKKADLLRYMPVPGQKTAASEGVIDALAQVNQRLIQKDRTMEVLTAINNQGQLATRDDIKDTPFAKDIEKSIASRAALVASAAAVTGAKTPKQIEEILGGRTPEDFEMPDLGSKVWNSPFNPARHAINAVIGAGNAIGGGLEGFAASLRPRDQLSDQMREETEYLKDIPDVPGFKQIAAFSKGAEEGFKDPWRKDRPWRTLTFVKDVLGAKDADTNELIFKDTPILGSLARVSQNPVGGPILAGTFDIATDPMNTVSFGGKTAQGLDLAQIESNVRQARNLAGAMDIQEAIPFLERAEDIAEAAGFATNIDRGQDVISRIDDLLDIRRPQSMAQNIRQGNQVLLSGRGKTDLGARVANDLPDWLRNLEAKAVSPFSRGMESFRMTRPAEVLANALNAPQLMRPEVEKVAPHLKTAARTTAGQIRANAEDIGSLVKPLDPAAQMRVVNNWSNLNALDDLTDAEQAAAIYGKLAMPDMAAREGLRGILTHVKEGYGPGMYSDFENAGKRRFLIDRIQGLLRRGSPDDADIPFKTYMMEGADDDVIRAIEQSHPEAIIKAKKGGLQVSGRFRGPVPGGTNIPYEAPQNFDFWPERMQTIDTPLEGVEKYGPLRQTGAAEVLLNRKATSIVGRQSEGLKETIAKLVGEEVPDVRTVEGQALEEAMRHTHGDLSYRTGELIDSYNYYDDPGFLAAQKDYVAGLLGANPSRADIDDLMRTMSPKANRPDIVRQINENIWPQATGAENLSNPAIARMIDEADFIGGAAKQGQYNVGAWHEFQKMLKQQGMTAGGAGRAARTIDPEDLAFLRQFDLSPGETRKAIAALRTTPKQARALVKGLPDDIVAKASGLEPRGQVFAKSTTHNVKIPKTVERYLASQKAGDMSSWFWRRFYDPTTNWWKGVATAWRPGFHARNAISNLWQEHLAGMNPIDPATWSSQWEGAKIVGQRGLDDVVEVPGRGPMTLRALRDEAQGPLNVTTGGIFGQNTMDTARLVKQADTTGLQRAGESLKHIYNPFSKEFPLTVGGRAVGRGIENQARTALWLHTMKQTGDPAYASDVVQKYLFDYGDLSGFEKNWMRRIMPFYAWSRKNIPLQIAELAKQPEKFTHMMKVGQASTAAGVDKWGKEKIESMEQFMPSWMRDAMATLTPFEFKGSPVYLNPNLPFQDISKVDDILKIFNPEESQDPLFNINPLIKIPIGLSVGATAKGVGIPEGDQYASPMLAKGINSLYGLFGKEPPATENAINKYNNMPSATIPSWLSFLVQQIPALNDINALMRTDVRDKPFQALSRLGGVKAMPFDWANQFDRQFGDIEGDMTDIQDRMRKAGTLDTEIEQWHPPELKAPPDASTLYDYLEERGLDITPQNFYMVKQLFKYQKGPYGPGRWPTLRDVQMHHKVRIPITMPKWDKTRKQWYQKTQKALPEYQYPGTGTVM